MQGGYPPSPRRGRNKSAQGNALGTGIKCVVVALKGRNKPMGRCGMSQSLVKNLIHLVYSTKHRHPWIHQEHRDELYAYQAGIYRQWDSPALIIGGTGDHVHALFSLSKNHAIKKIVEEVKKASSKWMKAEGPRLTEFYWQAGYGAFSVSQSNVEEVCRYIQRQEEHHRKMTFQEELRALFRRHGLEFDERYVWE
jgi:putative transposase